MATDNSGSGLWGWPVDTQSGALKSIASHPARDEFVLCGYALGPVTALGLPGTYGDPDNPLEDIIIAKLNATTGAVIWSRQIGGLGSQLCSAVAMDAAGAVYAAGVYNGTLDFGNNTGTLPNRGSSVQAIWVAKLDGADGHALVSKSFGTVGKQAANSIAVDNDGNVAISGNVRGTIPFGSYTVASAGALDAYVVKFDSSLVPQWATRWGDAANDQVAKSVAFTSVGDLVTVGYIKGSATLGSTVLTSAGLSDAYWAKLNSATGGESLCAAAYGNTSDQSANAMAVHGTQVMVAGTFNGQVDFAPSVSITSSTPSSFLFVLP
jgi:hypothetical protein